MFMHRLHADRGFNSGLGRRIWVIPGGLWQSSVATREVVLQRLAQTGAEAGGVRPDSDVTQEGRLPTRDAEFPCIRWGCDPERNLRLRVSVWDG